MAVLEGCYDSVTVWNRLKEPETGKETFIRHVLPVLCKWRLSVRRGEYRSETAAGGKAASAGISRSLNVVVPFCESYRPYVLWKELDNISKEKYFTLNAGDLIAKGRHLVEITGISPFTETEVRGVLGADCAMIETLTDNTGTSGERTLRGAHIKVGCYYGFRGR